MNTWTYVVAMLLAFSAFSNLFIQLELRTLRREQKIVNANHADWLNHLAYQGPRPSHVVKEVSIRGAK